MKLFIFGEIIPNILINLGDDSNTAATVVVTHTINIVTHTTNTFIVGFSGAHGKYILLSF